jgi:hypothetical protein
MKSKIKLIISLIFLTVSYPSFCQSSLIYNVSNTKIIVPNDLNLFKLDETFTKNYKTKTTNNIVTFTFEKDILENHIILYSNNYCSELKSDYKTFQMLKVYYLKNGFDPFKDVSEEKMINTLVRVKEIIKILYKGDDSIMKNALSNSDLIINKQLSIKENFKSYKKGVIYNSKNAFLIQINTIVNLGSLNLKISQYSGNIIINSHIFGISVVHNSIDSVSYYRDNNSVLKFIKTLEALNN